MPRLGIGVELFDHLALLGLGSSHPVLFNLGRNTGARHRRQQETNDDQQQKEAKTKGNAEPKDPVVGDDAVGADRGHVLKGIQSDDNWVSKAQMCVQYLPTFSPGSRTKTE